MISDNIYSRFYRHQNASKMILGFFKSWFMVCLFLSQSQDDHFTSQRHMFFFSCLNCLRARSSFSLSVSLVTVIVEYKYRYKLPWSAC